MSQFKLGSVIRLRILSHPWNVKNALPYGRKLALSVEENRKSPFSLADASGNPLQCSLWHTAIALLIWAPVVNRMEKQKLVLSSFCLIGLATVFNSVSVDAKLMTGRGYINANRRAEDRWGTCVFSKTWAFSVSWQVASCCFQATFFIIDLFS